MRSSDDRGDLPDHGNPLELGALPRDLAALLERAVALHGPRPAVRDGDGRWTWAELGAAARGTARWLTALGIRPGDRVLLALPPGRAAAAVLFGALRTGAAIIPVADSSSEYELRRLLLDAAPALVVSTLNTVRTSEAVREEGTAVAVPPEPELMAVQDGTDGSSRAEPDGTALLIYTSGSTGRPRGIVCPHRAVTAAAAAIADRLRYGPRDVVWNRLPMTFDYGLYQLFLCALSGAELVLPQGALSAGELVAIRDAGATVLPAVPTLATLLTRLATRDRRPTGLRLITNTGAALTGTTAEQLRKAFPDTSLVCMYGMSECKRVSIADPDEDLAHPGTVGRALPGTRLFVVDKAGRPLPPGGVGEIVSAGPHVMAGYWHAPEATVERFRPAPDGVGTAVYTGDQGCLDEAGRLRFVGRSDDLFKRRGYRMSTAELEDAMLDIPGVTAAAAVPPDPGGTVTVWAVTDLDAREVLMGVTDRLGPARTPDRCVVVPRLPLTAHGKVDRAALRATAERAAR
ncbi:class I adenylate-forming enzyme family protein [Streptomyces sp. GbtcB6]|uniref:class I adenylate-forming enzyme family protein n=1 Tax=Streptomyces sp. GbtcB6 TaxID=2824751 RepID=UPI0027E50C29|nr:class I adenylate-forming enzyme family protein [Streptomyces sp. GbtcB6]